MRTALGLLGLGVAGGIGPVGIAGIPYLTPLLLGAVGAFLILLTLGLVASALSRRPSREFEPRSIRPVPRRAAVVRSAQHRAI